MFGLVSESRAFGEGGIQAVRSTLVLSNVLQVREIGQLRLAPRTILARYLLSSRPYLVIRLTRLGYHVVVI